MVFNNSILLGAAGQGGVAPFDSTLIGNSIWLEGSQTSGDAMTRTWGAESNQDRWIWATWFQPLRLADAVATRSVIFAGGNSGHGFYLRHNSTASTFNIFHRDNAGSEGAINTDESYRDLTAWIHVLVDYDSANANAENRISLYVNGVRTGVNSGNRPGQNNNINVNVQNQTAHIGQDISTTPNYHMKGYLAQTVFLDNKSIVNGDLALTDFLDTFTFGTNGSQIVPKADADIIALASAAGANSFCLDYSDASSAANLVSDASSKGNNFSTSTIATANQSLHSPSKVYATWNALDSALDGHNTDMSLSDGGTVTEDGNGAFCRSTFAIPEGLFSYRVTVDDSTSNQMFGVALDTATDRASGATNHSNMYAVNTSNGARNTNGSGSSAVSGYSWSDGDTMEVYVSRSGTTYKIWYGKNGTLLNNSSGSQGDPSAGTNELFSFTHTTDVFFSVDYTNPGTKKATTDFGQRGYSPAEGALTLSTPNLLTPSYQGIDYFDVTLYEGNGNGQRVGDFVPFTDAYTVDKSAMFDDGDTKILSKTFGTADSLRKMTFSTWAKWTNPAGSEQIIFSSGTSLSNRFEISFASADNITIFSKVSNSTVLSLGSDIDVADTTQWVNIVLSIDTDQSSTAERYRLFINGVQQTLTGTDSIGNADIHLNSAIQHNIGGRDGGLATAYFDGYFAETVFIDNARLDASSFGQLDTSTNRWVPKSVSGLTFGANGFYLEYEGDFSSTSLGNDAGKDTSGRNNHFTQEGSWAATDQFTDTPSKNFNVFDSGLNDVGTLSEGNTQIATTTDQKTTYTTMNIPATGKWYWEVDVTNYATGGGSFFGIVEFDNLVTTSNPVSSLGRQVVFDNFAGNAYVYSSSSLGTTWCNTPGNNSFNADGDILQFALDQDAGKLFIGNNNTWFRAGGARDSFANASTVGGLSFKTGVKRRFLIGRGGSFNETYAINFGQQANTFSGSSTTFNAAADGSFVYTPPTGYKAVNQDNLDDTASKITAWAWIRNRDAEDNNSLFDRVRGVSKLKNIINGDNTAPVAESTDSNSVQRFLQRGVQLGNSSAVNTADNSYVLWQWLVGDSATTGTVLTNDSGIDATVIAADAGHFSFGTYTGTGSASNFLHGLGGKPEFVAIFERGDGQPFSTCSEYYTASDYYMYLSYANGESNSAGTTLWPSDRTATAVPIGTNGTVNASGDNYSFFAFRSIPGVCKIGSYVGNNTDDNAYISLGFRPRYFLCKMISGSSQWNIFDTARQSFNTTSQRPIYANLNNVESSFTVADIDMLSDGIKIRSDAGYEPGNTGTWFYMAMADIAGNGTLPPIYGR